MLKIILFVIIICVIFIILINQGPVEFIGGGARIKKNEVKNLGKYPRTKSEQRVIDIFEKITGKKFPTVNPKWLRYKNRTLELDGYNSELGIAVEFSGPLHTKYFPNKEPYKKYHERIVKDRLKVKLCRENGVRLIVVDTSIQLHLLELYIRSRLYDIGFLADKPINYTNPVIVEPWENKALE
jgi:hypothetical protein